MKINTMLSSVVFGGLLDQAIVSFGNFALGVYLARRMPAAGYGAFSFILSVVVFLNTIHQAFVIYPLAPGALAAIALAFVTNPQHAYTRALRDAA